MVPVPAHQSCRGRALTAGTPVTPRVPCRPAAAAPRPELRRPAAPAPAAPPGAAAPPRHQIGRSRRSGSPPPAACGTAWLSRVPAPPGPPPSRPPLRAHLSRSCRSCSASASFSRCRSAAAGPGPFGAAPPLQRAMCRLPLRLAPGTATEAQGGTGSRCLGGGRAAPRESSGTALGARAVTGPAAAATRNPRPAGRGAFLAPLAGRGQQRPLPMRARATGLAPPPAGNPRGGRGLSDGAGLLMGRGLGRQSAGAAGRAPPAAPPRPRAQRPHARGGVHRPCVRAVGPSMPCVTAMCHCRRAGTGLQLPASRWSAGKSVSPALVALPEQNCCTGDTSLCVPPPETRESLSSFIV